MLRKITAVSFVLAIWCSYRAGAQATLPSDFSVAQPTIPERTFKITDFGAVWDGQASNTDAITRTVAACEKAGGGIVEVPAGRYLTGPFVLGSNLNLHVDKGATILFSENPKDYTQDDGSFANCISVEDGHDVAITGEGTIDGNGEFFWQNFVAPKASSGSAGDLLPGRPRLIQLTDCSRVLVQGVTLMNSPSFHLFPSRCQDVTVENIRVKAPSYSPNTDGIDPSGANIVIKGCTIDTGDDDIAIKAGAPYEEGKPACENLLITDCTFLHGHGVSVGSETYGGLRNMAVRNCTFDGTEWGIRLKSPRGRGGVVEYLTYDHLTMKNVKTPILITSYYPKIPGNLKSDPGQNVGARTPTWRHIEISDLTSTSGYNTAQIVGLPEMKIEDLVLSNVNIVATQPMEIGHADAVRFVDCNISSSRGKPVIVDASVEGLN
jgi:polygalacturonase